MELIDPTRFPRASWASDQPPVVNFVLPCYNEETVLRETASRLSALLGELKAEGGSISEGIGSSRVTANFDGAPVDLAWAIADAESVPWVHALMHEEGINAGGSSGVNVAGAVRLARHLGPGHTIVTVLADAGTRYQAKLFNPAFLRGKDLPVPAWLDAAFPE